MTLATTVHIGAPINPNTLFHHILDHLATSPNFHKTPAWTHERKGDPVHQYGTGKYLWDADVSKYQSKIGQGLPAIWTVNYADDGPLDHDYDSPVNPVIVECNMDTAYGYRDDANAGCGDLHAHLVVKIAEWLENHAVGDVPFAWMYEYDGSWHSIDNIGLLGDPTKPTLASLSPTP